MATLNDNDNQQVSVAQALDEEITGTDGDNTIIPGFVSEGVTGGPPSDADDTINALGGNDVVSGGGGADTIDGGSGNDVLIGGADNDTLDGGDGADIYVFTGDHGDDTITAFANGADLINLAAYGLSGIDDLTIAKDGPNTVISGYAGAGNTITLENFPSSDLGAEDFIFDANANVILGTINDDVIAPGSNSGGVTGGWPSDADDTIIALAGNDFVSSAGGADTIEGGSGDDTLEGGVGNDTLSGGADDDTLNGGSDNDVVVGGDGDDVIDLQNSGGNDVIDGGEGNDVLDLGGDNDTLTGGGGEDIFHAPSFPNGEDTITDFTGGSDRIDFTAYDVFDVSDLSIAQQGANTVISGYNGAGNTITLENFDSANLSNDDFGFRDAPPATAGDDVIFGTPEADFIEALEGDDFVFGQGSSDVLVGDREAFVDVNAIGGDDFIAGGDGDDLIYGDATGDFTDPLDPIGGLSAATRGGNDTLQGDAGSDTLIGDAEIVREFAVGGNDLLLAGEGGAGGGGTLVGDGKLLTGAAQGGRDVLIGGDSADEIFGDAEEMREGARGGEDSLFGGGGDDVLYGDGGLLAGVARAGNDRLEGGKGNDILWGDAETWLDAPQTEDAADGFVFSSGDGLDTIGDFQPGVDKIVLGHQTAIDNFDDLVANHLTENEDGDAQIDTDEGLAGNNRITLTGFTVDDFTNGTIDEDDVVFSVITGTTDADTITPDSVSPDVAGGAPSDAADIINALGGNDTVDGAGGPDNIDGGDGDDVLEGGDGHDILRGQDGDDELMGGAGADRLDGGIGVDTLRGGDDNDILEGQGGNDTLRGDAGDDTLRGGDGDDTLDGGEGNDTLAGGADNDVLIGGAGVDSADFSSGEAVDADLARGTAEGQGSDTLSGIENLAGSGGDDDLRGDVNANTLLGNGGADFISGGEGDDTIDGGDGADEIDGGAGADVLAGGEGEDILEGKDGNDFLDGGNDDDVLVGDAGEDTLQGGEGEDDLRGGPDNDILEGGDNDDALDGGDGEDTLRGGGGEDALSGGEGNDSLEGGGNEDALDGGAGNDTLDGGEGEDTLKGDEGEDIFLFTGTTSDDTIVDFTQGEDQIDLSAYPNVRSTRDLDIEIDDRGDDKGTEISEYNEDKRSDTILLQNFIGRLTDDDFIFANGNSIYISDVQLEEGDAGSTREAVFTVSLSTPVNAPVTVDFTTEDGTAEAGTDYTTVDGTLTFAPGVTEQEIRVPILGDDAVEPNESFFVNLSNPVNDVIADGQGQATILDDDGGGANLAGTNADEVLDGDDGDDVLVGGNGDDALSGAAGDDALSGGSGDDAIDGGTGDDTLAGGSGDDTLDGGSGDDQLSGGSDNDVLDGGADNDSLSGGSGDDQLSGGGGDDALIGGSGNDTFVFRAADGDSGQDTIRLFHADEDTLAFEEYGESLDAFSDLDTNANGVLDEGDAHVSVQAGDTVIDLGGQTDGTSGGTLTLVGVTGLEADDMVFS